MYKKLQEKYLAWREARFLARHGCEDRKQYNRRYDSKINPRASRISDYYAHYPYVHVFEDPLGDPWAQWGDWLVGLEEISEWCESNCQGSWRHDIHRVHAQVPTNPNHDKEYFINEFGLDFVFFAFDNSYDALIFKLRWS